MAFNGATYGAALSEIKKVASGFDHATKTGDNTFDIYFKDGSKISVTIPGPDISEEAINKMIADYWEAHKSEFVTPQQLEDAIGGALNGTY